MDDSVVPSMISRSFKNTALVKTVAFYVFEPPFSLLFNYKDDFKVFYVFHVFC